MGGHVSRTDFDWVYTQEPHATRRKEILAKYPQIKKLMGVDPKFKYIVTAMVIGQFFMTCFVTSFSWPLVLLTTYCISGVLNHALLLAIHEISHNLAFGHSKPLANRLLGLFANLPIGVPCSISFKKYHLEHHRYQGDADLDMDIPTDFEGRFFVNSLTKLFWVILQPFFYSLRPLFVNPKNPLFLEVVNLILQFAVDGVVYYYWGPKALFYMIAGSLLGMGLHPVAGHFISEHYVFEKGYETYSYYGPLNWVTFHVGYHNEHHDFPNIPGSRLEEVRQIAAEYYDNLPCHTSWVKVLYSFIMDPSIGPYARIKRRGKATRVPDEVAATAKEE